MKSAAATHTPTPWHVAGNEVVAQGSSVAEVNNPANAAYIVRAVNAHEELLSALKIALRDHQQNDPHHNDMCDLCQMMTQAIAKAEDRP